jgi:transketolase
MLLSVRRLLKNSIRGQILYFLFKTRPVAILMHTIMGKGVDFMENDHSWHGIAPSDEQLAKALAQLPETFGDY